MATLIDMDSIRRALPSTETGTDLRLGYCEHAAEETLESRCSRRFVARSYSAIHSGSFAFRDEQGRSCLALADPESGLATTHPYSVSAITENGVSLTPIIIGKTAQPWADGQVALFDIPSGYVRRGVIANGSLSFVDWARGYANIAIEYVAGFDTATQDPAGYAAPADLSEAAAHLALLMYREGGRSGLDSRNYEGQSMSFSRVLIPIVRDAIDRYRLPVFPSTLA